MNPTVDAENQSTVAGPGTLRARAAMAAGERRAQAAMEAAETAVDAVIAAAEARVRALFAERLRTLQDRAYPTPSPADKTRQESPTDSASPRPCPLPPGRRVGCGITFPTARTPPPRAGETLATDARGEPPAPCVDPGLFRQAVARLAYSKAEQRGFDPGRDVDDWLAAERELRTVMEQNIQ